MLLKTLNVNYLRSDGCFLVEMWRIGIMYLYINRVFSLHQSCTNRVIIKTNRLKWHNKNLITTLNRYDETVSNLYGNTFLWIFSTVVWSAILPIMFYSRVWHFLWVWFVWWVMHSKRTLLRSHFFKIIFL